MQPDACSDVLAMGRQGVIPSAIATLPARLGVLFLAILQPRGYWDFLAPAYCPLVTPHFLW